MSEESDKDKLEREKVEREALERHWEWCKSIPDD